MLLIPYASGEKVDRFTGRVRDALTARNIEVSIGVIYTDPGSFRTPAEYIVMADRQMYEVKRARCSKAGVKADTEKCWVLRNEEVLNEMRDCFIKHRSVSETIHTAMLRYFREYMCVGGMPYVVDRFLTTNDMNVVREEQIDILEEFKDDFGKHLDENEKEEIDLTLLGRINRVFDSIPSQLAKENKKFTYSMLEKKGRSENYQAAIQWLYDAGIINICYNLSNLSLPLEGNKIDNIFKIYMQDSGLFVAMLEEGSAGKILSGDMGMYKGAIYENIVADAFSKNGRNLYYYHKDSGLEIDFISTIDGEISLVEVKATTGNAKSANTILKNKEQYGVNRCIKLSGNNVGQEGAKLTVPYYMVFLLN